jgi:hypothetical protein
MVCFREPARCLLVTAAAWLSSGCAGLLGLDEGTPEIEGGSDPPDGTMVWPSDAAEGGGAKIDAAAPEVDAHADTSVAAGDGPTIDSDPASETAPPAAEGGPGEAGPGEAGPGDAGAACMLTRCGDGCYDTSSDPNHCGNCTTICPHGANGKPACTSGACSQVCDPGYVDCGGHACGCGAGDKCLSDGTCGTCRATLGACKTGTDCCSGACTLNLTCL